MRTAEFVPKWCSLPCVLQVCSSNLKQHRIENFVSRSSRECAGNSQKRDCDRKVTGPIFRLRLPVYTEICSINLLP